MKILLLILLLAFDAGAACVTPSWELSNPPTTGVLQYYNYFSAVRGANVTYGLYLPPAYYNEPTRVFPVLYWLHGGAGDATSAEYFASFVDAAIAAGKTAPFIVVVPNAPQSFWTDSKPGLVPASPVDTLIATELIPLVDASYRTIATRAGRGIEGFSMGGRGAPRFAFKHWDKFALMSVLAGALQDYAFFQTNQRQVARCIFGNDEAYFNATSPQTHAAENVVAISSQPYSYRILVGDADLLATYEANLAFSSSLFGLGITHELTVVPGVKHCYPCIYNARGDAMWPFFNQWASQTP